MAFCSGAGGGPEFVRAAFDAISVDVDPAALIDPAGRGVGEQMGVRRVRLRVRQRQQLGLAVVAQQRSVGS